MKQNGLSPILDLLNSMWMQCSILMKGVGSTTAIICDDRGNFIGAQCKFIPFAADLITTEALAMRDGLVFPKALGCNRVEAESDSLQVINFCNGQTTWWDATAAIFA